jgi:SPP1 gp7 family putative phage head morphogenesis protein
LTQSQTLSESTTAPEILVLDNLLQFIEYHVDAVKSNLVSSLARDITIAYHLGGKKAGKEIGVSGPLGLQGLEPIYARLGPILDKTFGSMGAELTDIIKAGLKNGSTYATVQKQLADKIRSGWGHYITFDNTGESRKVVRVSPSGKLSFVDTTVTRPVTLSAETYADTLGRTAMKQAYAAGHFQRYQENGYKGWVYLSVCDERTRPWHLALHGLVFLFGSPEEAMAKQVMSEYNCRCRPAAWFDNASIDTPPSTYAAERKDWAEQALTENPTPPNAEYLQQVVQHSEAVKEAFDPSEPRDDQGKWTGDGGGSSSKGGNASSIAQSMHNTAKEHADRIMNDFSSVSESNGGKLVNTEYRVKSQKSIDRKINEDHTELLKINPNATREDAAKGVRDNIRFTSTVDPDSYTTHVDATLHQLESNGYEVVTFKNQWNAEDYHGINTYVKNPNGIVSELQFHTPESFGVKEPGSHVLYEIVRDSGRSWEARVGAQNKLVDLWAPVKVPKGVSGYKFVSKKVK